MSIPILFRLSDADAAILYRRIEAAGVPQSEYLRAKLGFEPRLLAALGDCAAGCAALGDPGQLAGPLEEILPVDLRIPGCPPTPQQIADALLGLMRDVAEHSAIRRA